MKMRIGNSKREQTSTDLYDQFFELLDSEDPSNGGGLDGYSRYQEDPIGFGEQVLGETYTDDVKALMQSVRDNPITIAISANATGKTHAAARIGVWFYKAHESDALTTVHSHNEIGRVDARYRDAAVFHH